MFGRGTFLLILLGAVFVPYLLSSDTGVRQWIARPLTSLVGSQPAETPPGASPSATSQNRPAAPLIAVEAAPVQNLHEVFRFDISTSWVLGRWTRVSTALADIDLQGYRVPLVTGTGEGDLAGSLTYYFNPKQRVQRIAFNGTTGDARPLVQLLAAQHGLVREPLDDPSIHVYRLKEHGRVVSECIIRPAPVVRVDRPHSRFDVALLLQRPSSLK